MGYKLRTSRKTEAIIDQVEASENLSWPTLARLAIALSLRVGPISQQEMSLDNSGKELNRTTVTGSSDSLFKCLIEAEEGRHLTDDEFFPLYIKGHLDRGAKILEAEKKYSKDLLIHLTRLDAGI